MLYTSIRCLYYVVSYNHKFANNNKKSNNSNKNTYCIILLLCINYYHRWLLAAGINNSPYVVQLLCMP